MTAMDIEQRLRDAVDVANIERHLERFNTLFRDSGTVDERVAAQYVAHELSQLGIEVEMLEFESLISLPGRAKLATIDADGFIIEEFTTRPRAFGASTDQTGIDAELIFVPFEQPAAGEMIFGHRAAAGDYSGLDVRGKAVVTMDGGPDGVRRAEERGAVAHIHIWPSDEPVVHEMIATSVWGTPTPESARNIPAIPSLGVTLADGEKLREQCEAGKPRVRIIAEVDTAWRKLPLVVANVHPEAQGASDRFLLIGAHIDSWYEGVTDNATGDVALIEMARVLHAHREQLRHGARFAWWPGHSTGRYSGSTWYADSHFRELRERCLGYLNIDSPGVRETSIWDCRYNMGEVEAITASVVEELSGQQPNIRRPLKAGDQSFLGVGLPSLGAFRMLPLDHPDRKAVGGCGGAWWWHSPEDTLDKADPEILADDTRIYLTLTSRLCTPAQHPYDFVPAARDFTEQLTKLQEIGASHIDLDSIMTAAERFTAAAQAVSEIEEPGDVETYNCRLIHVSRLINPALFTVDGPYEFDPALQLPILPGLAPIADLAGLDPDSDDYHYLKTKLTRQRNRIEDALLQASEVLEGLVG